MDSDLTRVAEQLGLRRAGAEFKGACPVCGGDDRFHIKRGSSSNMLAYCRHGCRYSSIMREMEKRGIVESDPYQRPKYKKDTLELADFYIAALVSSVKLGGQLSAKDRISISIMLNGSLIDDERKRTIRGLYEQLR